jgi:hypothetical protein
VEAAVDCRDEVIDHGGGGCGLVFDRDVEACDEYIHGCMRGHANMVFRFAVRQGMAKGEKKRIAHVWHRHFENCSDGRVLCAAKIWGADQVE